MRCICRDMHDIPHPQFRIYAALHGVPTNLLRAPWIDNRATGNQRRMPLDYEEGVGGSRVEFCASTLRANGKDGCAIQVLLQCVIRGIVRLAGPLKHLPGLIY